MDDHTLLVVMSVFTAVAAIALVVQMGLLFGMYKASKATQETVTALVPKVQSVLASAELTLEQTRGKITAITDRTLQITEKANEILDLSKVQLVKVDGVLTDASARARVQLEKAEIVVDDTMTRVHESVALVHQGIVRPLREINGVVAGVKAAFSYLLQGSRPSVDRVTQDEEMYI